MPSGNPQDNDTGLHGVLNTILTHLRDESRLVSAQAAAIQLQEAEIAKLREIIYGNGGHRNGLKTDLALVARQAEENATRLTKCETLMEKRRQEREKSEKALAQNRTFSMRWKVGIVLSVLGITASVVMSTLSLFSK